MPYKDALLEFADNLAVTTSAYATDTIDLLQLRDIGQGRQLLVRVRIDETFAGGTSAQWNIGGHLTSSPSADESGSLMSILGSSETHLLSPFNSLIAGRAFDIAISPAAQAKLETFSGLLGNTPGERYLSLKCVVAGTMTAGKYSAGIRLQSEGVQRMYPASTTMI